MRFASLFGIMCFLLFSSISYGQSGRKYVRIVVLDAYSSSDAQSIDQTIRSKEGVLTSRMDKQTGLYLGIYDEGSGLNGQSFVSWIENLGYTTKCVVEGEHGTGKPLKPLDRTSCLGESISMEE